MDVVSRMSLGGDTYGIWNEQETECSSVFTVKGELKKIRKVSAVERRQRGLEAVQIPGAGAPAQKNVQTTPSDVVEVPSDIPQAWGKPPSRRERDLHGEKAFFPIGAIDCHGAREIVLPAPVVDFIAALLLPPRQRGIDLEG